MHDDSLPEFEEALRLALAFYCIMEPEKRAVIQALVEKHADRTRLMETSVGRAISRLVYSEDADVESKSSAVTKAKSHLADQLVLQREYADHIRDLNFSILENAINDMTR